MSTMKTHNLKHSAKALPPPKGGGGSWSGEGAWKGLLLSIALLFLPLLLTAVENDYMKDPKYLLGAVPEVDGIVTFQKNFTVTEKSEQLSSLTPKSTKGTNFDSLVSFDVQNTSV